MLTRSSGGRYILSPGFTLNALYQASTLRTIPVDPIFRRAVRVGQEPLAKRVLARLRAPALAVGDEEALIAGEAAEHLGLAMLGDVAAIGGIGHFQPAEIADILAHGELAVDLRPGDRLITVELLARASRRAW
jgi:hypothetical protein